MKKESIINDSYFQITYDLVLPAMINGYSSPPKINGTDYLSKSTWHALSSKHHSLWAIAMKQAKVLSQQWLF